MSNHHGRALQNNIGDLKNDVQHLVDQGSGMAHVLKDKVVDVKDAAVDGALSIFGKATRLIRANPIATIAIAGVLAVGAGFVVVRMIRR